MSEQQENFNPAPDAPSSDDLPEGWLRVGALDMDAQGIARRPDGKVVFIEGALPCEIVSVKVSRKKNNWDQGACGGCKMQHLDASAQVAIKQRVLEDNLWHLAKVKAESLLRPIQGPAWGYRYRARLSVRYVQKNGEVLIGFHERKSRYIADMQVCPILPPHVSALLMPLRDLIGSLQARETCPQIELACGDQVTALVLRHLNPLSAHDQQKLRDFAAEHGVQWWLQPKGPDTVQLLGDGPQLDKLAYGLPDFGITMPFKPADFTSVNPYINRVLVSRALRLLKAEKTDRVIDWFCGLGNFTLPIATQAGEVLGIEGSDALVQRSHQNYAFNQSGRSQPLAPTTFVARNLFEMTPQRLVADGVADKWLVDPPREGAFALSKALAELHQQPELRGDWTPPKRIVYVSCNPATLARDAGLLVHQAAYRCVAAGVVNMFAHTAHVESMAVFERA